MTQLALYPGTFDPLTNGHVRIVERAASLFSHVLVSISENTGTKKPLLPFSERVAACEEVFQPLKGVSVEGYSGLTTDFFQKKKATFLIRGLRGIIDVPFELQLAAANQALLPSCETVFLRALEEEQFLTSAFIREAFLLGGDITSWVPLPSLKRLQRTTPQCL